MNAQLGTPHPSRVMPRLIAFYLPQFHPIPENDDWWGKGFTEWTNTAKAKPRFPGHYQPHVPADMGFYDLRVPETRIAQAALAKSYGIEGFCYYHYWFGGKQLLERPFNEVLSTGKPDYPFCLCWANETWTGVWHGAPNRVLIAQTYPGESDHRAHFAELLKAFRDPRYIRVDGKPLFLIYSPQNIPETSATLALWRRLAIDAGLGGLYIVGVVWDLQWDAWSHGYDAVVLQYYIPRHHWFPWRHPVRKIRRFVERRFGIPTVHSHRKLLTGMLPERLPAQRVFPSVMPNFDNSPRSGVNGTVLQGSTPALFMHSLRRAASLVQTFPTEHRIVFLKSWNEWAEGNHLEPDFRFGHGYLEAIAGALAGDPDSDA